MKKWICLLLALVCLCGIAVSASAEKGFETLYELFIDEEVFDEPDSAELYSRIALREYDWQTRTETELEVLAF